MDQRPGHESLPSTTTHGELSQHAEQNLTSQLPKVEIRCNGVSVIIETEKSKTSSSNISTPKLPSLLNSIKDAAIKLTSGKGTKPKHILNRVDAVFEPGTLTLVLGQPSSGKSTLLKVLSGQLAMNKNVSIEGGISYNGLDWKDLLPKLPQLATYVPQSDTHFSSLTVKETLGFAHACCGDPMPMSFEREQESLPQIRYLNVIIEQLGLKSCQDTRIGDDLIRGISGGERRRVTTGEMLFGPWKYATFMDEVTTGLDSATAFDIVSSQRDFAKKLQQTVVMALLQPTPEVFELFDNVLLLNSGEMIYQGPRELILPYFQSLGFECPPDRNVAEFLLDIATDRQQQYEVNQRGSLSRSWPRVGSEFAIRFRQSEIYQKTMQTLAAPLDSELERVAEQYLAKAPEFHQPFWSSTWSTILWQTKIALRRRGFLFVRGVLVLGGAFTYGSTFYNVELTNIQVTLGIFYQSAVFMAVGQSSEIPTFMAARAMYYKHRRANFYRSTSFVIAYMMALLPDIVGECVVFGSVVYWACGLVPEIGLYLLLLLCLVLVSTAVTGSFLAMSALLTNLNMAEPLSMFSIIFYSAFAGFVVPMARIPWFFSWLYWINPLAWCLRSVAVSQYRSPTFSVCVYDGEDYCEQFNKTIGEYLLSEYDVPSSTEWVWAGVVYLVFANIFFIAVTSVILESHRHDVPQFCKSMVEGKLSSHKTNQGQSTENEVANYVMISTPRVGSGLPGPEKDAGAVMVSIHEHGAFVPVTLAFKNLSYSTHIKHKSVELLKDVSGYAIPGTMTALMGSSGAGKTTLLDVIAGRKTEGDVRGEIFLNGYPATKQTIQRCTGYCEQQGIHSEGSTIREALTFSAILRQERGVSVQAKLAAVEECLDLLGLRSIADLIIRGRTQEQLKRLTIGVELAAQSSVLFLDEPTSGLDAHASKIVMDAVRKVANSGRTIVCTIHQPSSDIFCLFDSLLLLKQGGEMVYFGALHATPTNQCVGEHLIDYFQAIPGVPRISEGRNSATWMLECIGAGIDVSEGDRVTRDIDFVHHFRNSEDRLTLLREINRPGVGEAAPDLFREIVFHHTRAASSWTQLWSVTLRFFTIYWRTPSYNLTRLIIALSLGLVFGLLLVAEDFTTYQGMNSAVGVIFMTTLYQGNISFVGVLPFTAQERASYYRERNSQTYSVVWYFVGSTLVEIPYAFASGLIFSVVFYPMLGFTTLYTALLYWITVSLFVLVETYLGQFLVYALPTVELAAIVGVLLNSFFLLFSGFNPPVASIPDMYRWCYYISPHHYALSILVSLAFGNCPNKVTYDKATKLFVNTGSPIGCQPLENSPLSLGSVTIQEYIGQVYNMEYGDIWSNFGCIVACIVILRVLSLLAMRYLNHHKR